MATTRAPVPAPAHVPAPARAALLGRVFVAVFVAVLVATPRPAAAAGSADATPGASRTRIGLVLSGGGARGAAHVGVLRVLEELRVPIDFIAGTSMGAIVGASYASGSSVDAMQRAIASLNTDVLFRDQPPRQDQSFRRKQDDVQPYVGPEFGLTQNGLTLPKGAVSGISLEAVLRRLVQSQQVSDFDRLPIPFRAVATDIETGRMVVYGSGQLAEVMRASMSVPGAIAPAEIGGRMLVDGGLVRNLPVDVVRSMGADVVIAVNLGTPLLRREQITSVLGVSAQMINILTEQNVQASLATLRSDDVLISPALGGFSAGDFDRMTAAIPIGEAAARAAAPALAAYSLSPRDYAAWKARHAATAQAAVRVVDEVRIDGLVRVNPAVLQAELDVRAGEPIDVGRLDADVRRLYGRGDFEHVNYSFVDEGGRRVLAIDAVEKSWGPDYVRFGLGLSSDFSGESWFNLLAYHRRTWINALGAEWRNEFRVGRTQRIATEFYQPLDLNQWFFVAPRAYVDQTPVDFFRDRLRIARFNVLTTKAAFDVGSQFTKYGELRLGVERGVTDFRLDTGPADSPVRALRVQSAGLRLQARLDQLGSVNFPRSGFAASTSVYLSRPTLGADTPYTRWDADYVGATAYGPHVFQLALRAGGRLGSDPLPDFDAFQWGGFLQQSGYRTGQLLGRELRFGRVVYTNRLFRQSFFEGLHAGVSLELGKVSDPVLAGPTGLLKSIALFVAFDSPLGPLYLGLGQAADGNRAAYLYLGRP